MLILTRKWQESIVIGDDIRITVVSIKGDKVKLGIDAPPEVTVHRKEVHEMVKELELDKRKLTEEASR